MNRRAVCLEAGTPRTAHAPCYHNYLGFPGGISGEELLRLGREQAERWGAVMVNAAVTAVEIDAGGPPGFLLLTTEGRYRASGVVFATGVKDRQLRCGNLYGETRRGVHYCVVCDGLEVRGKRVAVVGSGERAVETIEALRDFTADVHLLLDGEPAPRDSLARRLEEWGVRVHPAPLEEYRCGADGVRFASADDPAPFPHVFIATGVIPRTDLAGALGCRLDGEDYIATDARQATSVPFVYAAGDCDGGRKQVTQAMAEGETAGIELARTLRQAGVSAQGAETAE
jgi:thioredoxin reductase (NADPH)